MYFNKIDYSVILKSWKILKPYVSLPYVIHIVGTNGKGSTGRYLASFLYQQKKDVLHYSSPHIIEFNERIWINGNDITNNKLEKAHEKLLDLLPLELLDYLTYFEYTTLLALYLSKDRDYLVLEAGLGGEFDATNVVKNDLSIFTPIGLDHQNFLGHTVREITQTKMRSCDTRFIMSKQIFDEVDIVKKELLDSKEEIIFTEQLLNQKAKNLPVYLQNNLETVINVLEYLGLQTCEYKIPELFGRFQKLNSNIIIDVGHNSLAAKSIAKELEKENKKLILIYNTFKDKDYKEVLKILKPYISEVQIINCDDERIVNKETLEKTILSLSLKVNDFDIMDLEKNYYLVFGSFLVVENFLKGYNNNEKR